jgi:hypothetical protein
VKHASNDISEIRSMQNAERYLALARKLPVCLVQIMPDFTLTRLLSLW